MKSRKSSKRPKKLKPDTSFEVSWFKHEAYGWVLRLWATKKSPKLKAGHSLTVLSPSRQTQKSGDASDVTHIPPQAMWVEVLEVDRRLALAKPVNQKRSKAENDVETHPSAAPHKNSKWG